MKTLLILILSLALLAAAFFTRPTEADFERYFKDRSVQPDRNWLERTLGQFGTDSFLQQCTYRNRYLWTDVEHDGAVVYTGAFSHWFERNAKPSASNASASTNLTAPMPTPEPSPTKSSSPLAHEVKRGK